MPGWKRRNVPSTGDSKRYNCIDTQGCLGSFVVLYCSTHIEIKGEAAEEGSDPGPGQIFAPFLAMEDLLDKLKLLNYERELVMKMRMRPINR